MTWVFVLSLVGPFAASLVLTGLCRRVARRIGFVDRPGGHKGHARPVPLGGGVAILLSFAGSLGAVLLAGSYFAHHAPPAWLGTTVAAHLPGVMSKLPAALAVLGCAGVLGVIGLVDDVRPLPVWLRLVAQFAVAGGLVATYDIRLLAMAPPGVSVVLTILWLVGITNAFNFLDHSDGLAAGVAAIGCATFVASSLLAGQMFVPALTLMLIGSLLGFLCFNFPPARIFMGDAGSLPLGFLVGVLTVMTTFYNPELGSRPAAVLTPLVALAVPIYDTASVLWQRLRAHQSIWRSDRRHFGHRLKARGLGARGAVLTIYLATAATGMSATLLARSDALRAGLVVAQCACIVLIIAILERTAPATSNPPGDA